MKHVDDVFLRQVTQLYRQRLPEGQLAHPQACHLCWQTLHVALHTPSVQGMHQLLEFRLLCADSQSCVPQAGDGCLHAVMQEEPSWT